jgi:hypothetical protein
MTYAKDEDGRYRIPAEPHEPRVEMDCSCGYGLNAPERVWDYVSGQHASAHQKGTDGLPGGASWNVRHIAPEQQAEAG